MAYDLEEQEQLANLKAWWAAYGKLIVALIAIAAIGIGGWTAWKSWQSRQARAAAALYEQVQTAAQAKDLGKAKTLNADLTKHHGTTIYAAMSNLLVAKTAIEAKDVESAKAALQEVVDHGSPDESRAVARLRLAGLLLDQKAYDQALKALDAPMPASFAGLAADRRGDVLTAQGKVPEARKAYAEALQRLGDDAGSLRSIVQIKLDALGEG